MRIVRQGSLLSLSVTDGVGTDNVESLNENSDSSTREFFWVPPDSEDPEAPRMSSLELQQTASDQRLPISKRDWVRIRVEEEIFDDTSPTTGAAPASGLASGAIAGAGGETTGKEVGSGVKGKSPYRLVVSFP